MTMNQGKEEREVEIRLKRAADDPEVRDEVFQQELRDFARGLRLAGLRYSQRAMAFDSAAMLGYPLAEFVVKELGPPAIAALATLVGTWIGGRNGRKVRLKVGDVEVEARTIEEVRSLLEQADAMREKKDEGSKSA